MITWPNTQGERNRMATLTEAEIKRIRALAASGEKQVGIARALGVTQSCVSKIVNGGRWAHVQDEDKTHQT